MKKKLHIGLLLLGWILSISVSAQTAQQVEQQILAHLKHIQYWRFEYSPEDTTFKNKVSPEDSVLSANKMLEDYLMTACVKEPASLRATITLPENSDMKIVSSDDGKIRMYSWDSHTGQNDHDYYTVCQYETSRGVKAINNLKFTEGRNVNGPQGKSFQKIYTVAGKYYIAVSSDIAPDNNIEKRLQAIVVKDDKLSAADIFEAESNSPSSAISYVYNYSSNYDFKKMKEEYDIRFEKQKLYIPEVKDYKMTGKYQVYNFDGTKFTLDKNTK